MGLTLNGTTQLVDFGGDGSLDVTGSYTVSIRFKTTTALGSIINRYDGGINVGFTIQIGSNNRLDYFHVTSIVPFQYNYCSDTAAYSDGNWHNVIAVFENGVGSRLYVAGALVASDNTYTVPIAAFLINLRIANQTTNNRYFAGSYFDARLYNRAFSVSEIESLFKSDGNDGITNGLVFRSMANEKRKGVAAAGAGVVLDSSGHSNHGTPANSPVYLEVPFKTIRM